MKKNSRFTGNNSLHLNNKIFRRPLIIILLIAASCLEVIAQTNPAAQSIPHSQNFLTLAVSSTVYPGGWQGWQLSTSGSSTAFRTTAATADLALIGSSTAAITTGGVHNYSGKIGILASSSADPALCLAINTTGVATVQVNFDVMTIRNPFDGSANTRINQVDLQYRVGTSGAFTSVSGIANGIYQNNTTNQTTAVTTPQNTAIKSFTLPAACNNQAVVQLRWVQRDFTGAGSRPSFAVDNIVICNSIITPTISITGPTSFCSGGTSAYNSTITNGGTTPVYQWKKNGVNIGTNSATQVIGGLIIGDQISCSLTSNLTCTSTPVNSNTITIATINTSPVISSFNITNASCPQASNGGVDITVTGGTAPYSICWDTVNTSGGASFGVTFGVKTFGHHPFFGSGSAFGYIIDGVEGKELTLTKGITYSFNVLTTGHPFFIASDVTGGNLNFLVSNGQGGAPTQSGTVTFTPNNSHPSLLYYDCQFHQFMGYRLNIQNGFCVEDLTGRRPGTYSVIVTDANGCTASAQYTIGANPSTLSASAVVTNASCSGSHDGAINLSVSGGTGPYTVCWDTTNTANGPDFSVMVNAQTPSNPYYGMGIGLTFYTDGVESKVLSLIKGITYSFNVFSPGHPWHISTDAVGGSATNIVTNGQSGAPNENGTVTFTPNNSHPPLLHYVCANHQYMGYNINIVDGFCTEDLSGLAPGTYTAVVVDANGCSTNVSYTVNALPSTLAITGSVINETCNGHNGAINIDVTGGTAPYTVCWDTINIANGPQFSVMANAKTPSNPYFNLGSASAFYIDGVEAKELSLMKGITYNFNVLSPGHPWHISTDLVGGSTIGLVTSGQTGAPNDFGNVFFTPNSGHPSLLYYVCANHAYMGYNVNIVDGYCVEDPADLGPGIYTVLVTDANGCSTTSSFTIGSDPDITNPSITCPGDIVQCDNFIATFNESASDDCAGVTSSCSPASGSTFNAGTTNVICTAQDASGNTKSCAFNVTINESPVIGACPSNITQCDNHVATWTNPTATGTPAPTVTCSPASGSTFVTGTTTVTCTATNSCGSSSCSFTVTINETPAPVCPGGIITSTGNPGGTTVTYTDPGPSGSPAATSTCTPASGSNFVVGTTTVTCTQTNSCGTGSCSFNVTVNFNCTPPTIGACPSNITQCDNHVATWTDPVATGGIPTPVVTCSPASGSTFATGTTTVTCTASNGCAPNASCTFTVTINESPVIGACPSNITQCDNHVATWTNPTATGTPTPTVSCSPASGSTFVTGTTSVTCTATNSCGSSSCSFSVTINESPVIGACPSNITQCDNHVATWTSPTATGTPTPTVTCSPASGSTFVTGTTSVTCTASNSCGSSSCSFTVTINETPAPVCPGGIITSTGNPGGTTVTYTDPAPSGSPAATSTCTPASGSNFVVGTTTVTCTQTNSCGTGSCSFNVTVNFNCTSPTIGACPSNITQCDNHVATWTDPVATGGIPTPVVTCSPASGSTFATGTTTVTCTASNGCAPNASCTFTVTINESPVIGACPSNITQCDNHVATWTNPTATGTPTPTVSCSPASGSTFTTGTTSVTCTATNSCGSSSCSFTVTINESPVIGACPADIAIPSTGSGAVVTYTSPTASGNPTPVVVCSPSSGSTFPNGITSVTCTATNSCGSSSCSFNVNVTTGCTPPVISSCPSDISQCSSAATWTDPTATGSPSPTVVCTPASGSVFPAGNTTVTCTATNTCGTSSCTFNVTINTPSTAPTSVTSNASFNNICLGNNVTLTEVGGSLGTSSNYEWYEGGCGAGTVLGTGPSITLTPSAGIHTYYVLASAGACSVTGCASISITVNTAPPSGTIHITAAPSEGCVGNTATVSVNSVAGATRYHFTGSDVLFNGNPSPYDSPSPSVTVTFSSLPAAGSSGWSICVFAANSCGSSNTICSWVRATLSAPATITGNVIGCPSTTGNAYSTNSVAGAATYTWTSSTPEMIVNGSGQNVTVDFTSAFVSGTLCVQAQMSCGYLSASKCKTITKAPATPGTMSGPSYVCPNGSSVFSISAVSGASSYTWTTSVPGAIITPAGASASILFPSTIPGGSTVCVTALNACGNPSVQRCKGIASGVPNIPGNISGPASGQCGQTGVSYSITPVPLATSYLWSVNNGATISGLNNLSGVSVNFPSVFSTVTVSVVAINGCGTSVARSLVVNGLPGQPGTISGNTSVCNGAIETYSTGGSAGATSYNWMSPSGSTILNSPPYGASVLIQWGATGGNVSVTAVNACGTSPVRSLAVAVTCRHSQIEMATDALDAEVYPNPAGEKAILKFNSGSVADYHLSMTDVVGQIVLSADGRATEGINLVELKLSALARGIYSLGITIGNESQQVRIVVE